MTDFLLELRSEEIPARMQDKARADLERLFVEQLATAGLKAEGIITYATPRRLTLIATNLPLATEPTRHETKGPKVGAPEQAIEGFLRKYEANRDELVVRDGAYFLDRVAAGRMTTRVLGDAVEDIIRAFPWPKSMRWGAASLSTESQRWVRPLQGIVAILGEDLVPCEIAGVQSGYATVGHRFHHPGDITIGGAHDYVEKLRACHVIVDQNERRAIIAIGAKLAAQGAGLTLVEDQGLLNENAGLTEWPVPLLGRFDTEFLSVPPEVIQLTARVNQKYFVCNDSEGKLANAFICTANIDAEDGGDKIVEGNRKVLAARLSDARFFYETDLKVALEEQAKKLEKIVFHEKLGTVADKVDRVAKLARWLVEEGIVTPRAPAKAGALASEVQHNSTLLPSQEHTAQMAERAARLAKADLVTGMVGEFPELQGLMGGYYAQAQGEPREVWEAVRDHYKPVGQGDQVPTAPVTVAVSLADKLDTLLGFYLIGQVPTGSKDPYALRRAGIGVGTQALAVNFRVPMTKAIAQAALLNELMLKISEAYAENAEQLASMKSQFSRAARFKFTDTDRDNWSVELDGVVTGFHSSVYHRDWESLQDPEATKRVVLDFIIDRLKVQQREAGVRHDLIDAVFALGGEDDLVRLLARVHALQAFMATEDGANLLAGYKRAANILKKEGYQTPTVTPAEVPGSTDPHNEKPEAQSTPEQVRGDDADRPQTCTPEPAETALIAALDAAEPRAVAAIEAEDFEAAMAALASLRGPIDLFFDKDGGVMVNDPDPVKRTARLALLARMRAAVHRVADFSKIEG